MAMSSNGNESKQKLSLIILIHWMTLSIPGLTNLLAVGAPPVDCEWHSGTPFDCEWHSAPPVDCEWRYNTSFWKNNPPILIDIHNDMIILPDEREEKINIGKGEYFLVSCTGSEFKNHNTISKKNTVKVKCDGDTKVLYNTKQMELETFVCKKSVKETLINRHTTCGHMNAGKLYEIAFVLDDFQKMSVSEICFCPLSLGPLFTQHKYNGVFSSRSVRAARPSRFVADKDVYHFDPDPLYKVESQINLFTKIFNLPTYIDKTRIYLARGHLTPDGDLLSKAGKLATYHFSNVVPQFQCNNNGNWKSIEDKVRKLASSRGLKLSIYTGSEGVFKVTTPSGVKHPVYLKNSKQKIPAPLWMWKIVHDPLSRQAAAIMMLNDPYPVINDINHSVFNTPPCIPVFKISWIKELSHDHKSGVYCVLKVDDLLKIMKHPPIHLKNLDFLY